MAIDNGACMHREWYAEDVSPEAFDNLRPRDADDAADLRSESMKRESVERTKRLTDAVIDEAFAAIPKVVRNFHDEQFQTGKYTPAPIDQKKERIKRNLVALRDWESRYLLAGF